MGYKRSWQTAFGGGELGSFGRGMAAASIIQRAWRRKRMRKTLAAKPYSAYKVMYPRNAATRSMLRGRNLVTWGALGTEYKHADAGYDATQALVTSADASGMELPPSVAGANIFTVAQGDDQTQRDGARIIVKEIMVRGQITFTGASDQADVLAGTTIALWLVLDTQTNGAQCSSEQVFVNASGSVNLTPWAYKNTLYSSRFRILKKWLWTRGPITAATDGANTCSLNAASIPFQFWKRVNIPVTYTVSTGLLAAIQDNSLHLMGVVTNTNLTPTVSWNSRIRFIG